MLAVGQERPLELEDLLRPPDRHSTPIMVKSLHDQYKKTRAWWFLPHLMVAMIRLTAREAILSSLLSLVDSGLMAIAPLFLQYLLEALQSGTTTDCYMWAAILTGSTFVQITTRHSLYYISMRAGLVWKNAATALIHEKLLTMDANKLQNAGCSTGVMVNLISNDVARYEEFAVVAPAFFVTFIIIGAVLSELVLILDVQAAFTGVGCAILAIPALIAIAQKFAQYRGQTAASTDSRVRYISEVIEGIASVKSYAWETAFFQMIRKLRAKETKYIAQSQVLRSINQGLMFSTAVVAAFATFSVYWSNGGTLTIPLVFSTLSLLQVLRFQVGRIFTRSIETGSEAIASCRRIEAFLDLDRGVAFTLPLYKNENQDPTGTDVLDHKNCMLKLRKSSYRYGSDSTVPPILKDISFEVHRGELLIVVGPVGSGKSSLLSAALGELHAILPNSCTADGEHGGVEMIENPAQRSTRTVQTGCRIAYCAQRPWILAASVKSNITLAGSQPDDRDVNFKNPEFVDQDMYRRAVESSLIVDDMEQWPAYDDTEVGERGISVSGGQKARISLARAVYSDADLYVLDDPLSAVDAHVGKALMDDCIIGALKKRNKATLLVTHQLQYLEFADRILVLASDGTQTFYGNYQELQTNPDVLAALDMIEDSFLAAEEAATASLGGSVDGASPGATQRKARSTSKDIREHRRRTHTDSIGSEVSTTSNVNSSAAERAEVPRKAATKYDPDYRVKMRAKRAEIVTSQNGDDRSIDGQQKSAETATTNSDVSKKWQVLTETQTESQRRQIVQNEDRAVGNMSWGVYWQYIRSGGALRGILALSVMLLSQGVVMITEYWMRWWATSAFGDQRDIKYICIFAGLVALCVWIGFYRALGWFAFTLRAASDLQERCLWAVMHSPMTFFASNPTGRVLNRFSRDQNQVDELLPLTIFFFLETGVYSVASLFLICITLPWIAILVPIIIVSFIKLREKYICSTREIKRIEAVTRSPIYADFSATLEGLTTLRAYQLETRVAKLFQRQVDENARAVFSFMTCARWLGLRLDAECTLLLTLVCFLAVILRNSIDVGLLGFALVYTMSLSGTFQWMVRASVDVETQMTAVERIHSYSKLPSEDGYRISLEEALLCDCAEERANKGFGSSDDRLFKSPTQHQYSAVTKTKDTGEEEHSVSVAENYHSSRNGNLQLKDLTVTYRHDLDPVLKHISLDIPAGYKVGICGRTGSGKSSTLLALLRLNIITSGDIVLDGESLLAMDLQSARSQLSIIPQDPHLFSGTVRFNLDPFSMHTDTQIWCALEDAHIQEHIKQDPLGLSAVVEESGKNFSVGQRQLLSLARAILRESKVVLMDEVTASIDYLTDRLIQETIRTSPALRDSTIITVAHRLRTIADSDLVVVVHAGEVVEMGPPGSLLKAAKNNPSLESPFAKLVQESNEYEEIFKIASSSVLKK